MRHQQSVRFYAAAVFFLFLFSAVSPETMRAQWTTGPGNINNTNTGNVGIDTGIPPSKLTVSGGDIHVQTPTLVSNGSMGDIGFGPGGPTYGGVAPRAFMRGYFQGANWYNGSALAFFTHAGDDITNGNTNLFERMRIDKDGNVGIGTSSPAAKLQIYSRGINSRTGISIDAQGTQTVQQAEINLFTLGNGAKDAVTAGTKGWHLAARGNAYLGAAEQNDLQLYFWNGTTPSIRQSWDADGNVGIGTATPNGRLDVVGASGSPNYATGLTGVLRVGAPLEHIEFGYVTGNRNWIQSFGAVPLYINEGGNNVILNSGGGSVGIGMTTPAYKLDVNGEINATGLRINGAPVAAGGSTQWTTSGSNVFYNTGNVGIGIAAPSAARLHLHSAQDTYLRIGAPLASQSSIAFNDDTNGQDIVLYRPGGTRDFAVWTATSSNVFTINQGGNVGIGTTVPTAKLHVVGDLNVTGNINAKYQDVAEWVESSQKLEAGTVVALDTEKSNQVIASTEAYDTRVAGVISAQPGISLGERGEGKVLVATTGRVKVRVDATRAPIKIGDLLVTSDVAGVAMKSEPVSVGGRRMHAPGTLIGKALEPLEKGRGEILVLLSMQ